MARLLALCSLALLAAAAETDEAAVQADHEARAQKALTDSLTDALAMLRHGSNSAKEQAAHAVATMAVETTLSQPFHPVTFRNACVNAGVVGELARLLSTKSSRMAQLHALSALEAIATDDPTTDLDNGHAFAVCNTGVVTPIVALLSSNDESMQVAAASCAAVLAENPTCQTQLLTQGAVEPLVALGSFGNDVARMHAVAALDLLVLNNPQANEAVEKAGGLRLLKGLKRYGSSGLRATVADMHETLTKPVESLNVAVDAKAHATQAHQARMKHSKVLEGAMPVRRAYAPGSAP
ncbi:hypothetical protein AB1Y20_002847 [Prymnesium parvum]|uniref:Armadillo repeat-containing protein 8 n=1 Tax=Prymnesium parvum TaxID=97485 RepID=A0AB34JC45_PRYPA